MDSSSTSGSVSKVTVNLFLYRTLSAMSFFISWAMDCTVLPSR